MNIGDASIVFMYVVGGIMMFTMFYKLYRQGDLKFTRKPFNWYLKQNVTLIFTFMIFLWCYAIAWDLTKRVQKWIWTGGKVYIIYEPFPWYGWVYVIISIAFLVLFYFGMIGRIREFFQKRKYASK